MTIEQTNVIDFPCIDSNTGDVVLGISDHLPWDQDEGRHLVLLQDKLNTYLMFIEGGQILETYPDANKRKIIISIVGKYPPSETGNRLLKLCEGAIREIGVELRFELFNSD